MPGTDVPKHLVHQILHHAHALLAAAANDDEEPPLAALLARAADHVPVGACADLDDGVRDR